MKPQEDGKRTCWAQLVIFLDAAFLLPFAGVALLWRASDATSTTTSSSSYLIKAAPGQMKLKLRDNGEWLLFF
jgi:hypothetical protein